MRLVFFCLILFTNCYAQSISQKLEVAVNKLQADPQGKHAIISLYVADKTGKIVFEKNAEVGLAPASCQKVVTAAAAFELLGNTYTYKTTIGYNGKIADGILNGNIFITGSGDPTLGSWRYSSTNEKVVIKNFLNAIEESKIKKVNGSVFGDDRIWGTQRIPDGWIWQDIGNYYGAGASGLNWRENQYDLILQSGEKIGDAVKIVSTAPGYLPAMFFINELSSAEKGSGDKTYIYMAPDAETGFLRGTIPINEKKFVVSGSMPDGGKFLAATVSQYLGDKNTNLNNNKYLQEKWEWGKPSTIIYNHTSPPLDSIIYWFLKRSVNLYGEALVKTIGYEKKQNGSTDTGIKMMRDLWSDKGIERSSLKIIDGSGLSPANRVTTKALVSVLRYAETQKWFSSFYYSLPEINGIKMKDGYIGGVRSYTGYVKSNAGTEYTFSFIINNFDGSASTIREKMWKVLDILK